MIMDSIECFCCHKENSLEILRRLWHLKDIDVFLCRYGDVDRLCSASKQCLRIICGEPLGKEGKDELLSVGKEIMRVSTKSFTDNTHENEPFFQCIFELITIPELFSLFCDDEKLMDSLKTLFNSKLTTPHTLVDFLGLCLNNKGVETVLKYNFVESLFLSLSIELSWDGQNEYLLARLEQLLEAAENLVEENQLLYNPIAVEAFSWIDMLAMFEEIEPAARRIKEKYFGESWENYLARKRGLKTKKAN